MRALCMHTILVRQNNVPDGPRCPQDGPMASDGVLGGHQGPYMAQVSFVCLVLYAVYVNGI